MKQNRLLASLLTCGLLLGGTSACASTEGLRQDEVIRTAPLERLTDRPASSSTTPSTAQTFDAISDFLDASAAAWTSGDVDAVMDTYVHDEPLLVFLGDTPVKGPEAVRGMLEARAQDGGLGAMSYEWFESLQFDANTAVVSGRVVLDRKGQIHRGLFTRVLRRTPEGWRIVHDQLAWGPDA